MKQPLLLLGGGGHCKSCIDVIEATGAWEIVCIVDLPERKGETVLGYPILGSDTDLPKLVAQYKNVHITLGHIGTPKHRKKLAELAEQAGANFPVIVSPLARVSRHAEVGAGTIVMHQVIVNASARVGSNVILNNKALVEHDAVVGDFAHISTGAIVNGGVTVGAECLIGSGAVTRQGTKIAVGTTLGAGSIVAQDIEVPGIYVGVPARLQAKGES